MARSETTMPMLNLRDRLDHAVFNAIYSRNLIYNACWEDPAIDRQALAIGPGDRVMTITSAGCNALDYALLGPARVDAVDANPRQNALLELKIAGIQTLEYEDFFAIFGRGYHADFRTLYRDRMRGSLSSFAQAWWDKHANWFSDPTGSFYSHGLSGLVARAMRRYFKFRPDLHRAIQALLEAPDVETQRIIYDEQVAHLLWTKSFNWVISRQLVMSLLGVPYPQRKLVEAQHSGGVASFIREAIEYVFRQLPLRTNYFWRVYLTGRYERDCCPEYLREDGFRALKAGLVDRVHVHTKTVTEFLHETDAPISRFVLLDHMDWMSSYYPAALIEEWNAIIANAAPHARIILRSAQARPPYLDSLEVGPDKRRLRDMFVFLDEFANELQATDRVHTYPGFVIAYAGVAHAGA